MLAYVRLAEVSERRHQLVGRDKLLVLATAAACRAGWIDVGERCRQLVLEHNAAHLIGTFASAADAIRSPDFAPLVNQLERMCGYERAEFLVDELGLDAAPDQSGRDAGEVALSLLSGRPEPGDGPSTSPPTHPNS